MTRILLIIFSFGIIFFGMFGCKSSHHAEVDFTDGSYSGTLDKSGKKNGKGIYRWNNGSIYDGEYRNDLRHGHGRFMWANGESYTGDYRNDERTGKGIYLWPDGSRYEGDFLSGMRHGRGIFTSTSGVIYEGEWFDDSQHGAGTLTYPDGRIVRGIWRRGELVTKPSALPPTSPKPKPLNIPVSETDSLTKEKEVSSFPKQRTDKSNQDKFPYAPSSSSGPTIDTTETPLTSEDPQPDSFSLALTEEQQDRQEIEPEIQKDGETEELKIPHTQIKPDWIGTVREADDIFLTELIDGLDTVSYRKSGGVFTGRMRIINEQGKAQGEVNLLNGRLHGEEIFFNQSGDVIESNFWENGRQVVP